jgi:enterochelin esterase family protein
VGIANVILDNLIAAGKAKPMIVVMPNAYYGEYASLDVAGPRRAPPYGTGGGTGGGNTEADIKHLIGDLIPFVDKNFRTLPRREQRALAGTSMGSEVAGRVVLTRLDVFASLGMFGAKMFDVTPKSPGGTAVVESLSPGFLADPAATNKKLRLFFLGGGTEDRDTVSMSQLATDLREHSINVTFKTYPGGHEWKVWRRSLADMASLLFR